MKLKVYFTAMPLLLAVSACSKFQSFTESSTSGQGRYAADEAPQAYACDPETNGENEKIMRRLSKQELLNSLNDLFGAAVMNQNAVQLSLQKIPDQVTNSPANFDNRIVDVEGLQDAAATIAGEVFKSAATAAQVLPGCALATMATCQAVLIDKLAYRAFRRPLTNEQKTAINSVISAVGGIDGLKAGIVRILISPHFHQHIELGEATTPDSRRLRLDAFEVAERLSFRITGSLPDPELLAAAAAGKLSTISGVKAQGSRLLTTAQARKHWAAFISDWLQLQKIGDPSPVIGADFGIETSGLGAEARDELLRFADHIIFNKRGNFQDLYLDKTVFATSDRLAAIYGVPKSDQPQTTPGEFAGILLRPAKLMSAGVYTSPILRGVYVRKRILCNEIPSPSGDIVSTRLAELDKIDHAVNSNRDITATVTQGSCMGCHSMINPVGFALENFGPFGLPQKLEKVYAATGPTGKVHPVVSYVQDLGISSTRAVSAADAQDLNAQLAHGARAKECLSQKLIEQTRTRRRDEMDNCLVNHLNDLVQSKRPLLEILLESAVHEGIFWKSAQGVQL